MACYWDTSALLALLMPEPGRARVTELAGPGQGLPGFTSFFTFVEMESAYARRLAEGVLTRESLADLRLKAHEIESSLGVVWPDAWLLSEARRLVPEVGLRPADALHLASAKLALRGERPGAFASLDERLNRAAQAVGLSLPW